MQVPTQQLQQTEATASSATTKRDAMATHIVMVDQGAYIIIVITGVVLLCNVIIRSSS